MQTPKSTMADSSSPSSHSNDKQQSAAVQLQRVTITNNYGEKLVGVLHETGSKEVAILCHGLRSSKDDFADLATILSKEGISAFRFDFAGNGESEGLFHFGNYQREAEDLHAVILHFSDQKRVIASILGHSKGGNVVLLYASKYHDIPMVINVSGRYNMARGIEERLGKDFMQEIKKEGFIDVKNKEGKVNYRVTEESLMERLAIDMHAACLSINPNCRVFTIHGSKDEIIPAEDAFAIDKIIPNHKLHVIEGADHGYTKELHRTELAITVLNFLKAAL